ncbi:ATP-binding protein [Nocardia jejuensis]|uniref:ATP-binding protein n=1 Tax=Nocardia jejuensis TaxID=328049 RepID=UPI0008349D14|nr:ATP-binding protein [Nocardia jejuensis]
MGAASQSSGTADRDPVIVIDLDLTSLEQVRAQVRRLFGTRTGVVVDDAVQVADELVSNARRHGSPPRSCRLIMLNAQRLLRIEVEDSSPVAPTQRARDTTGGLGMVLIDRLSHSWGVIHHENHKTVWVEIATDRPGALHMAVADTPENPEPDLG